MTMQAVVISVRRDQLLVFDLHVRQRVVVHTPQARRFQPGNIVCIQYSGAMTMSIPPQISATRITLLPRFSPWHNPCRP